MSGGKEERVVWYRRCKNSCCGVFCKVRVKKKDISRVKKLPNIMKGCGDVRLVSGTCIRGRGKKS